MTTKPKPVTLFGRKMRYSKIGDRYHIAGAACAKSTWTTFKGREWCAYAAEMEADTDKESVLIAAKELTKALAESARLRADNERLRADLVDMLKRGNER